MTEATWAAVWADRSVFADLLALGLSMRAVAAELGRSPSTVKRELDRHRDDQGRYLPRGANHRAQLALRRPRTHKLVVNKPLRLVVQRKLNRCWSPDEISGWLRLTHPEDESMQLCSETIYRALLVPSGQELHKRYCRRLRTGRRIRKSGLPAPFPTPETSLPTLHGAGSSSISADQSMI